MMETAGNGWPKDILSEEAWFFCCSEPRTVPDYIFSVLKNAVRSGDALREAAARLFLAYHDDLYGDPDMSLARAERAQELAKAHGSLIIEARASIVAACSRSLFHDAEENQLTSFIAILTEFRDVLADLDLAIIYNVMAVSASYLSGRKQDSMIWAYEAFGHAVSSGCLRLQAMVLANLGSILLAMGSYVEAERVLLHAVKLSSEAAAPDIGVLAAGTLTFVLEALGEHERACGVTERWLDLHDEMPPKSDAVLPAGLAFSLAPLGDVERASNLVDQATNGNAKNAREDVYSQALGAAQIAHFRGFMAEKDNNPEKGLVFADAGLAIIREWPEPELETKLRELAAMCAAQIGDKTRAYIETSRLLQNCRDRRASQLRSLNFTVPSRYELEIARKECDIAQDLAVHDQLTGLKNRRYFEEATPLLVNLTERHRQNISLSIIDLDNFKSINDSKGHPFGDSILRALADVMLGTFRDSDIVARYGGEEFCIVMPDADPEEAGARIKLALEKFRGATGYSFSAGVSGGKAGTCDLPDLITLADEALYKAKRTGRSRVEIVEYPFGES